MSIRSIVLIMLLTVSTATNVVVGVIGYVNGRDSLRDAAFSRMIEVRDSRAREVEALFRRIENSVLLSSRSSDAIDAVTELSSGFAELDETELTPEDITAITAYYEDDFGPRLFEATGENADPATFIPTRTAERYLKLHYTIPFENFEVAVETVDAGDGSAWSAAHAAHHDYFKRMTELFRYEDTLLLDANGNVIYTAYKGIDLGTNLVNGPFRFSNLAGAYAEAMRGNVLDSIVFTDFDEYAPSLDVPAAWAVAPIGVDGTIIGAIAVELPIEAIDDVMTGGGDWAGSGLGATGETYLVGQSDKLMRSPSRDLLEDPDGYEAAAIAAGIPGSIVAEAVRSSATLLLQPVRTSAVEAASSGRTGTTIAPGYLGGETLSAFAPLEAGGQNWIIVAEIDSEEAFAPVDEFTQNLVLSSAIIVLIVSLFSLLIAGVVVRPLRRLRDAARRIAGGETGVQVNAGKSDELADVALAFNDMSRALQVKATLLEEQQLENERLLLSLMPETLARKYKSGEHTIVLDHQEVTVLYADIVGFEEFSKDRASADALEMLNEILDGFDEAADRYGVELVRTTRAGYLASCGLTVPRVDSARRAVDFSIELQQVLARFGGKYGARLALRAGIDTGTVTSGLVGQSHVVYDLWGDAVSLAFQIQGGSSHPGIFITQSVMDRLPESLPFTEVGAVNTGRGVERVWRIDPEPAGV